jgi:hypothetical protein
VFACRIIEIKFCSIGLYEKVETFRYFQAVLIVPLLELGNWDEHLLIKIIECKMTY